jgi:hypothetical protein
MDPSETKIFLDDVRPAPPGWTRAYWPEDVIELLKTGKVTDLSLDHDLGDDAHGTGYDVLQWLEKAVAIENFRPIPNIVVHSANSPAKLRMEAAIKSIQRYKDTKKTTASVRKVLERYFK